MTGKGKRERVALDRLADVLVDDILSASDEDILAEFRETFGDSDQNAAEMRALFEKSVLASNKKRLAAAKAAATANRRSPATSAVAPIDMAAARARLRAVVDKPGLPQKVTLAARKRASFLTPIFSACSRICRSLACCLPTTIRMESPDVNLAGRASSSRIGCN